MHGDGIFISQGDHPLSNCSVSTILMMPFDIGRHLDRHLPAATD
jgi:hypothetical protein